MPFIFENEMPELKLGDLDKIPCSSRKVSGGRAIVARKYPNRDGQSSEDLGREPYVFDLEIPLFADVDPDHYPTMWDELRSILESPPRQLEFRDHEFGTMHVSVPPGWTSTLDATKRDGVLVHLTLTEDDLDIAGTFRETTTGTAPNAESAGDELDAALEEAGVNEDELKGKLDKAGVGLKSTEQGFAAGSMWSNQGAQFTNQLRDGINTAEQIAASVDIVRGRADAVLGLPQLRSPANAGVMNAAILFADAIARLGDRASASSTVIVQQPILDVTNVFELSARLYGTPDRASEIIARNPLVNPLFIRPGTRILVAA